MYTAPLRAKSLLYRTFLLLFHLKTQKLKSDIVSTALAAFAGVCNGRATS